MSGSSTPQNERDGALLSVGAQCHDPTCHLVDFLPFKCQHCAHLYCQDHFKVRSPSDHSGAGHACDQYDEARANRVAPSCPLCSTPIAIPPGEDPNARMDRHIAHECSVVTGRQAQSRLPHCARVKCGKVLYAPIGCDRCRQQFCPAHRFPNAHNCAAGVNARPAAAQKNKGGSGVSAQQVRQEITQVGARGAAAVAAIKRSFANAPVSSVSSAASRPIAASAPKPTATSSTSGTSSSQKKLNPFNATDR
jgi:hypothetical protein